jgi:hypothetical protein
MEVRKYFFVLRLNSRELSIVQCNTGCRYTGDMQDRPDIDPALPRYAIAFLTEDGWEHTNWKMTIPYAKKQFAGQKWWPIFPSEQFYKAEDMPIIGPGSTARFAR